MPRTGAAHLPSLDEALIRMSDGLAAIDTVKKLMADLGRPHDNLYEVALWEDMMRVERDEAFYPYMVDNQAIVIPQTIDAIRAPHRQAPRGPTVDRQDGCGARDRVACRALEPR